MPVLINVKNHYESALRYAYRLDDAIMEHHDHEDAGNWGVHWRLDEVLRLCFPSEHTEDSWPKPPWYPHGLAEEHMVTMASEGDVFVDKRRKEMIDQVNLQPKGRRELEMLGMEVWDESELELDFNVLGYRDPFVVVERLFDGARGTLMFQYEPRLYFEFREDRVL